MSFIICCICQDHIRHNNEKTIMNTTRGDQTDDVVDMNNVKLVSISDKGFMIVPPFNTTKGDTTMKKQLQNSRSNRRHG